MAQVPLTNPKVEAFACPPDKDQAFLWDADTPGLAVRATAGGAKALSSRVGSWASPCESRIEGDGVIRFLEDAHKEAIERKAATKRALFPPGPAQNHPWRGLGDRDKS